MSRKIKFRAFLKSNKLMYDVLTLDIAESKALIEHGDMRGYAKYPEECELMQYTNIKDKNRKEIYEWDIVQCTDKKRYGLMYIVSFEDGAFCFNDIEYPILYRIHDFPNLEDLLIVGNIYENEGDAE